MSKTRRNMAKAHVNGNGHTNRISDLLILGQQSPSTNGKSKEKLIDKSIKEVIQARTPNQKTYIKAIIDNDVIVCQGPAGCGKTRIAVGMAALALSRGEIDHIYVIRPLVSCDEEVGFLPGDLEAKTAPFMRPVFDEFCDYFTDEQLAVFAAGKHPIIEVVPLAMIKGRNFKKAWILFDETQDGTYAQIKSGLTRFCEGSKIILTGDPGQSDRDHGKGEIPFQEITQKLLGMTNYAIVKLDKSDNQRHKRVEEILDRI